MVERDERQTESRDDIGFKLSRHARVYLPNDRNLAFKIREYYLHPALLARYPVALTPKEECL